MSWPGDAMAFYGWGFVNGITHGRDQAEGEMAHRWRHVVQSVQHHVNDPSHAELAESRRRHLLEACAWWKANARPCPAEDPNPSARVLNGWPNFPRRTT